MFKKVLIIDEHNDFRQMLRQCIERQNSEITVLEAGDVNGGLKKAFMERPEAVFLDINLLNFNGINVAGEIKNRVPKCGVIVLTMENTEMLNRMRRDKNVDLYICKDEVDTHLNYFCKKIRQEKGGK